MQQPAAEGGYGKGTAVIGTRIVTGKPGLEVGHGDVLIAAITSCTNTSNPAVLLGAGLLAKKAVERGLKVNPRVKTSLAPGSRVVNEYLQAVGAAALSRTTRLLPRRLWLHHLHGRLGAARCRNRGHGRRRTT